MSNFVMTKEMWDIQQETLADIKKELHEIHEELKSKADVDNCDSKHNALMTALALKYKYNENNKKKIQVPDTLTERLKWMAIILFLGFISGGSVISLIREITRLTK